MHVDLIFIVLLVSHVLGDFYLQSDKMAKERIERIMDGLLDFCDDEKFLALYKDLCRHVYNQYPQLVGEHINLFRL